jgi:hypothetical protein
MAASATTSGVGGCTFRRRATTEGTAWVSGLQRGYARGVHGGGAQLVVGAFLGPYRNLTTLTASVLALHPHVQVLNHAGRRLLARPELDFVRTPSRERFERFREVALAEARGGSRGMHGGSITLSHAFDVPVMRAAYRARFGTAIRRRRARALVWKDSLVLTRAIRRSNVEIRQLLDGSPGLRFLVPIRYPLDCAASCVRYGHAGLLSRDRSVEGVLEGVLHELAWARALALQWPRHVFVFWEHEFGTAVLRDLARYLELEVEARWIEDANRCFVVTRSYEHPAALVERYTARVAAMFEHDPGFAGQLMRFVDTSRHQSPCSHPSTES